MENKHSPFFDMQRGKTSSQMRTSGKNTPLTNKQNLRDKLRITLPSCNEDNIFDDNRTKTKVRITQRRLS